MPRFLSFSEPSSADYIYIDMDNKVHLLLPIVGGDTIGVDNTCKTVLELQTFYVGARDKTGRRYRQSAKEVLEHYALCLEADLRLLHGMKRLQRIYAAKQVRLHQINHYRELLEILNPDYVITERVEYPRFPTPVQDLLAKKTNCFSIHLRPKRLDNAIRTTTPVFSVLREENNSTFAASLARGFRISLGQRHIEKSPKQKIVEDAVNFFEYHETVTLDALMLFLVHRIREVYGEEIVLNHAQSGHPINLDYFTNIIGIAFADCDVNDAALYILGAALSDDFWQAQQNTFFALSASESGREQDEEWKLSIQVQFFLAEINIYCYAHGLSTMDFGQILERFKSIRQSILTSFNEREQLETCLFSLINKHFKLFGLRKPLHPTEQHIILNRVKGHFQVIKESPHFDEFIIFDPEVRGAFFNHRNRISMHFLELYRKEPWTLRSHGFLSHMQALYESSRRHLPSHHALESITVHDFLCNINTDNIENIVHYLTTKLKEPSQWASFLGYEGMMQFFCNPLQDYIKKYQPTLAATLVPIRQWFFSMQEKVLWERDGTVSPGIMVSDGCRWESAITILQETITEYTKKFKWFRTMTNTRREQMSALDKCCRQMYSAMPLQEDRIDALCSTLSCFFDIAAQVKGEKEPRKEDFLEKMEHLIAYYLDLFSLRNTVLEHAPCDVLAALQKEEKARLPACVDYPILHELKAVWWQGEALARIQALPCRYYNRGSIDYLNSIMPDAITPPILKALQTDVFILNGFITLDMLEKRGLFLFHLEATPEQSIFKGLGEAWWSEENSRRLQGVHKENCSEAAVLFLNQLNPNEITESIWIVLHNECIDFTRTRLDTLCRRGQFLLDLYAQGLSEGQVRSFSRLDSAWWGSAYLKPLILLSNQPLPEAVIAFLSTMHPQWASEQRVIKGLESLIARGVPLEQASDFDSISLELRKLDQLGSLSVSFPILYELKPAWWYPDNRHLIAVLSLGEQCYTPGVVNFLNKINPTQLSDEVIIGLKCWNKEGSLSLQQMQRLGRNQRSTVLEVRHTTRSLAAESYAGLSAEMIKVGEAYASHTRHRWFDIGRRTHRKNTILQGQLALAIKELTTPSANTIGRVRDIIQQMKASFEVQYGSRSLSWSWFKWRYVTHESSRLLQALLNYIDTQCLRVPSTSSCLAVSY